MLVRISCVGSRAWQQFRLNRAVIFYTTRKCFLLNQVNACLHLRFPRHLVLRYPDVHNAYIRSNLINLSQSPNPFRGTHSKSTSKGCLY